MADDADRAQVQLERFEYRRKPARAHVARLSDDCLDCGDAIESARLKAVPHAIRCAECQAFFEQSSR